jgi:uncharacterized protein YndB with AHSA1/START domain
MTTPDVPHRFELELEVPGTPEEVWRAIATAEGISAWMMQTELEEREGGRVVFHMGPEGSSEGRVTAWEPGRRIAYEEDWAALVGQPGAPVTPLVTEFLVEARSGGTCSVRIVTSAFGTGADWENEFWGDMEIGWAPMLDNLRVYLTHFPGQRATMLEAGADKPGAPGEAVDAVVAAFGADATGQRAAANGVTGVVERRQDRNLAVRIDDPVSGLLLFFAWPNEDGRSSSLRLGGYLFGDGAAGYAERERAGWAAWLESLDLKPASTARTSA